MRDSSTVFVIHGTKKFRDRVKGPTVGPVERSTTALGDWYATVLFWKPYVALFVNERTLLPVLMAFAPAATVLERFPAALVELLRVQGVPDGLVDGEVAEMSEYRLAPTTSRSVVGIMNEFAHLGRRYASARGGNDLVALSLRLSRTPCGPLYGRHGSPDRELAVLVAQHR